MKIGRYEIKFGKYHWIQTQPPTTVWSLLFFTIFKKARSWDVDKRQQFPPGTPMIEEGRTFRYYKFGEDVVKDKPVGGGQKYPVGTRAERKEGER